MPLLRWPAIMMGTGAATSSGPRRAGTLAPDPEPSRSEAGGDPCWGPNQDGCRSLRGKQADGTIRSRLSESMDMLALAGGGPG